MKAVLILILSAFFLQACDLEAPQDKAAFDVQVEEIQTRITEEKEDLLETYQTLETKIQTIQTDLSDKKEAGLQKVAEIQAQLEAAQQAFEETKEALDKLSQAGQALSESLTPSDEPQEEESDPTTILEN